MKKIIKYPDGRQEEFEGTPAELAALEKEMNNKSSKDESKKSQKKILLENDAHDGPIWVIDVNGTKI